MAASDTHVADPLDTVHHEMDSMARSHRVYNINIILREGALSSAVQHLSYYWEKKERKRLRSTK